MVKCMMRDVDMKDDDEYELFKFYVDECLPKACGNTAFPKSSRRFYRISDVKFQVLEAPERKVVTPEAEAFMLIVWENNITKWHACEDWRQKHPNEKLPARNKDDKTTHFLKAKWTDQDAGAARICRLGR